MEALVEKRGDVRLVKVDVRQWNTPVAQQYRIRQLPTVWLYRGDERIADDVGTVMRMLQAP